MWKGKNGETRYSSETSEELLNKPTKHPKPKKKEVHEQVREDRRLIPTYRNGCKNSERILWMTEFVNAETHAQVLLMEYLESQREVRIWVNTVLILTFRKTETARSAQGPKLQGPHAEDAMVEPYLVLKNLVT